MKKAIVFVSLIGLIIVISPSISLRTSLSNPLIKIAFGQTAANAAKSNTQTVQQAETVMMADLGVANPGLLPTNPFYFFKELGRDIQRVFTFDPVAKAQLEVKIANEKAAEAKKIQETVPNDNNAIAKGIENYVAAQNKLINSLEFLKSASSTPKVENVINSVANNIVLQEKLLNEINNKAGDNAKVRDAFKAAINQINNAAATTVLIVEDIKKNAGPEDFSNLEKAVKTIISTTKPISKEAASSTNANLKKVKPIPAVPISQLDSACTTDYNPVCAQPPMPPCPKGMACIQVMPPLKTFSNECVAKNSGATIEYYGECNAISKESATTTKVSINCLRYDPVCGEDGKTYSCGEPDAKANGTKVAYIGECNKETSASTTLTVAASTTSIEINCGKENEKVNRDPLSGPINKPCCEGLKEDRSNILYSICVKPAEDQAQNEDVLESESESSLGIANPASVYCVKQGYKNEIKTNPDGSQYGVCIFNDGTQCDEWEYFRGECKPGVSATSTLLKNGNDNGGSSSIGN